MSTGVQRLGGPRLAALALALCLPLAAAAQSGPAQPAPDGPTRRGAVLRSLLLPGWGHAYLQRADLARPVLIRETALWLAFDLLGRSAAWYAQDYRGLAAIHAGADFRQRPAAYYYHMAQFDSMEEYNQEQLRRRNLAEVYPDGLGWEWNWDDPANRERFNDLRLSSLTLDKGARFVAGGLILNRAAAVVQILFLTPSSGDLSWRLVPWPSGTGISLELALGSRGF